MNDEECEIKEWEDRYDGNYDNECDKQEQAQVEAERES